MKTRDQLLDEMDGIQATLFTMSLTDREARRPYLAQLDEIHKELDEIDAEDGIESRHECYSDTIR